VLDIERTPRTFVGRQAPPGRCCWNNIQAWDGACSKSMADSLDWFGICPEQAVQFPLLAFLANLALPLTHLQRSDELRLKGRRQSGFRRLWRPSSPPIQMLLQRTTLSRI
jgi:hypothetical protein